MRVAMSDHSIDDLRAEISRAEGKLDARPLSERVGLVARLRSGLTEMGITITPDDEKVLSLYVEGVLDSRHLGDQFDARIFAAGKAGR
jgi:hypothetical protein